jgi:hypothetical protein
MSSVGSSRRRRTTRNTASATAAKSHTGFMRAPPRGPAKAPPPAGAARGRRGRPPRAGGRDVGEQAEDRGAGSTQQRLPSPGRARGVERAGDGRAEGAGGRLEVVDRQLRRQQRGPRGDRGAHRLGALRQLAGVAAEPWRSASAKTAAVESAAEQRSTSTPNGGG